MLNRQVIVYNIRILASRKVQMIKITPHQIDTTQQKISPSKFPILSYFTLGMSKLLKTI